MLRFRWLIFFVLMSWKSELRTVWCYPHGVATGACGSMMPGHNAVEQTSPCPYVLQISKQQITAGESITVTLSMDATVQSQYDHFLGFFIRVADANAKNTTALGQFGQIEHGVISYFECFGLPQSTISHDNNVTKTSISAEWIAPYFNGEVVFLFTVVYNYETFWAKRETTTATVSFEGSTPVPPTTTPTPLITGFDYSVCGVSQSCFGFPDKCVDSQACTMIVSYYGATDKLYVNMAAATVGYMAVGFSKDSEMGDDSIIQCMIPNNSAASVNILHDNYAAIDDSSFTMETIDYSDGTLKCTVTRPISSTVTSAHGSVSTDLGTNLYYLLIAMGYTNSSGNGIVVHAERTSTPLSLDLMSTKYMTIDSDDTPKNNFDYSVCGVSQSCFGFPDKCVNSQSCTMIVSYNPDPSGKELQMSIVGQTSGYVAVGLSTDMAMGADSVIECVSPSSGPIAWASINNGHSSLKATGDMASYFILDYANLDSSLECRISRPVTTTVISSQMNLTTDLNANLYYLLLAYGPLNTDETDISRHTTTWTSGIPVNLMSTEYIIIDSDSTPTIKFDYSVCGVSQSCFGNPLKCVESKSCHMLVSYYPDSTGETLHLTLVSNNPGYVALGLSQDTQMGDDSVIECMLPDASTDVTAMASVNDGHQNDMASGNMSKYFTLESSSYADHTLTCSISREITTTVKSSAKAITTDINANTYYLLLAKGPLNSEQTDITEHDAASVSGEAVDLMSKTFIIVGDQTKPNVNVVIHGSLMVVAWIGTVSVAIFMARFYKDMWPEQMWCKVKIWFAIHRALNVITVLLTMAAFILIFVYKRGFSSVWKENAHPIIGTFTMGFAIIQPFGSLFRCAPGTPNRPIFNWLHFCLGNTTCILALATIFLAVNLKSTFLPKYFWWILVGFIVFYCVMYCEMEFYVRRSQKKKKINDIVLTDRKGSDEPDLLKKKTMASSLFKNVMLGIFLCGVTGFTIALVTVICTAKASS